MGGIGRRPIPHLLGAILLALTSIVLFTGPASATTRCSTLPDSGSAQVCVEVSGSQARGVVNVNGTINGLTLTLEQCDGAGHNCTVIAATHSLTTSWKPTAAGHAYHACASYTASMPHYHVCSPFIAVPT
jgi:hypothetical protein